MIVTMKRTVLIFLFAIMLVLSPAALRAQEAESLYNGWGLGFQAGGGGMFPTGSLADDLKGCAIFTGGLNAEVKRLRIKADVAYGQPSFKNSNPYAVFDEQGRNLQLNASANPSLLGVGLQLGYTVWRHGVMSVTPLVGVNWNRLSWDLNHIKYDKDEDGNERSSIENVTGAHESGFGWMASVDIDFRLHGQLVDSPFDDNQGHYSFSLRISPFVAYAKYGGLNPKVSGLYLGATVTYAGLLRLFKQQ